MHQVSRDDKPIQIDIENAENSVSAVRPISKITETTTDVISFASATASQLDAFIFTYLEPLRIFNTVVNTIANVCLPLADIHI